MDTIVVLVGLGYRESSSDALPGVVVDLYRMYKYAEKVISPREICVVTDITREENIENLREVLLDGKSGSDILCFFQNVQRLVPWTRASNISPRDLFSRICRGNSRVLWYFTGHGKNGCMVLPDGSVESMQSIMHSVRDAMCDGTESAHARELLWIIDCCHSSNLGLPFVLREALWERDDTVPAHSPAKRYDENFFKVRIISLSSSTMETASTTSVHGSAFTQRICEGLRARLALPALLARVNESGQSGNVRKGDAIGYAYSAERLNIAQRANVEKILFKKKEIVSRAEFRASFASSVDAFTWSTGACVTSSPCGGLLVALGKS